MGNFSCFLRALSPISKAETLSLGDQARNKIKEMRGMLEEAHELDPKRKQEIQLQLNILSESINKNRQPVAKLMPILNSIERVLIEEITSKGSSQALFFSKTNMRFPRDTNAGNIMGAIAAIDTIKAIVTTLEEGSNLDAARIKEIKVQLKILDGFVKMRQWDEAKFSPLLESIENEVKNHKHYSGPAKQ